MTFPGCFKETTVGPSPQGRLEMNYISTPLAVRDTGLFYFTVYKDPAYESVIAELAQGIYVEAGDL